MLAFRPTFMFRPYTQVFRRRAFGMGWRRSRLPSSGKPLRKSAASGTEQLRVGQQAHRGLAISFQTFSRLPR